MEWVRLVDVPMPIETDIIVKLVMGGKVVETDSMVFGHVLNPEFLITSVSEYSSITNLGEVLKPSSNNIFDVKYDWEQIERDKIKKSE